MISDQLGNKIQRDVYLNGLIMVSINIHLIEIGLFYR